MNLIIAQSKKDASVQLAEVTAELTSDTFWKQKKCLEWDYVYFYNTMMSEIRQAIEEGNYKEYKKRKIDGMMNQ